MCDVLSSPTVSWLLRRSFTSRPWSWWKLCLVNWSRRDQIVVQLNVPSLEPLHIALFLWSFRPRSSEEGGGGAVREVDGAVRDGTARSWGLSHEVIRGDLNRWRAQHPDTRLLYDLAGKAQNESLTNRSKLARSSSEQLVNSLKWCMLASRCKESKFRNGFFSLFLNTNKCMHHKECT